MPFSSPGSPTLILVPTEIEARRLAELGGFAIGHGLLSPCGFGPVAAAARTAELLAYLRPRRVLLLGCAGSYDLERAPLGSATCFSGVVLDGVGAGRGESFLPPARLGIPQWAGLDSGALIEERIELCGDPGAPTLLTVCSACASPAEALERRRRYPWALAEDMEGFGAAFACRSAGVPLVIVRGFSNAVGERDKTRWRLHEAMAAVRARAIERLAEERWEPER